MTQRENQGRPKTAGKKKRRSKGGRKPKGPGKPQRPAVICSVCDKPIDFISTAVSGFAADDIAHLECIVSHIEASEQLTDRQKVVYIGQGTFAVVEYRNVQKQGSFTIVRKIVHENGDQKKLLKASIQDRLPSVSLL